MSKGIIHSIILVITIAFSFLMARTALGDYDLQIAAFLFIVLFMVKKFILSKNPASRLLESVVFTIIVLSIINSTGGSSSPFFFLIYFLLFSLSLLIEPVISITATVTLIIFFLVSLPQNQDFKNLLPIFSLAFLTPFALFMGQEYIEDQKSKAKSQKVQQDTFLFLSLMLKNHLKTINQAVENFLGDKELTEIKKSARKMNKLIEEFEKS